MAGITQGTEGRRTKNALAAAPLTTLKKCLLPTLRKRLAITTSCHSIVKGNARKLEEARGRQGQPAGVGWPLE